MEEISSVRSMTGKEKGLVRKKSFFKKYEHLLFIGPHLVLFITFVLIPLVFGLYIALSKWDMITQPTFTGLENFRTILLDRDSTFYRQFWNGLKNTVIFVLLALPPSILIPFAIALAINNRFLKAKKFFQSVFYIPGLMSITAVGIVFSMVFNRDLGIMNALFQNDVIWSRQQPYAWLMIVLVSVWWGIGGNMVIYIAAIAGVDRGLYEAAEIDGAGSWAKFRYVTLPGVKAQILYTTVMSTSACFNLYGQPVMLTSGGPNESTKPLMMYIRELAFGSGTSIAGIGSAMAFLLGLIILVISLTQFRFMDFNKEE